MGVIPMPPATNNIWEYLDNCKGMPYGPSILTTKLEYF